MSKKVVKKELVHTGVSVDLCPSCGKPIEEHKTRAAIQCVQDKLGLNFVAAVEMLDITYPTLTVSQDVGVFSAVVGNKGMREHFSGDPKDLIRVKAFLLLRSLEEGEEEDEPKG